MTNDITVIRANHQQGNDKGIEVSLKEENVRDYAKNARELFSSIQNELDEIEDNLNSGLSYLDMKNDTLLSYMIDLCNIYLRKIRGETISGHPSIERSVYYRIVLDKIKAIDQRLAYQLNKVITMPDDAAEEAHGVNINNLDLDLGSDEDEEVQTRNKKIQDSSTEQDSDEGDDDDDDDDDDDEDDVSLNSNTSDQDSVESVDGSEIEEQPTSSKNVRRDFGKKSVGVYKPPKLRSVAYDEAGTNSKGRRRRDYHEFYQDDDGNRDIVEETRVSKDLERTRYEEENYTRLPDMNPKKVKRKARQANLKGKKKFKSDRKRR